MGDDCTRKIVRATKEITVNIGGEVYDALLIPRQDLVEVDFTDCREDDPLRRQVNIKALIKVDLDLTDDLVNQHDRRSVYHLSEYGAKRLLESL